MRVVKQISSNMATVDSIVKVFVSTIPGLEFICVAECDEVFGVKAKKEGRGRVSFSIAIEFLPKLSKLKSVHHYWLTVFQSSNYLQTDATKEKTLENLEKLVDSLEWSVAIRALNYFKTNESSDVDIRENTVTTINEKEDVTVAIPSAILAQDSTVTSESLKRKGEEDANIEKKFSRTLHTLDSDSALENTLSAKANCNVSHNAVVPERRFEDHNALLTFLGKSPSDITFRVTCNRSGKHDFTSMEAAKYLGSGVKGYFGWSVNLENHDIEILAFIEDFEITIAIKLSSESKHNRNVKYFGPTTLRATTSYCMLKLAGIKPGSYVVNVLKSSWSIVQVNYSCL